MGGTRSTKETGMGLEVEVELDRVGDVGIDHCSGPAVSAPVALPLLREEANVVAFADHDDGDERFYLEFLACLCENG